MSRSCCSVSSLLVALGEKSKARWGRSVMVESVWSKTFPVERCWYNRLDSLSPVKTKTRHLLRRLSESRGKKGLRKERPERHISANSAEKGNFEKAEERESTCHVGCIIKSLGDALIPSSPSISSDWIRSILKSGLNPLASSYTTTDCSHPRDSFRP